MLIILLTKKSTFFTSYFSNSQYLCGTKINKMLFITLTNEFIQDLYADAIESSVYVSLEPVERNYLTNSPADYKHHLTKICFGQVKPKTKPTLRPRCRSFLLASSNANSSDDPFGHR